MICWLCFIVLAVGLYCFAAIALSGVSDDPTKIHTLRKYVGQAEDKTSIEAVRAKQQFAKYEESDPVNDEKKSESYWQILMVRKRS